MYLGRFTMVIIKLKFYKFFYKNIYIYMYIYIGIPIYINKKKNLQLSDCTCTKFSTWLTLETRTKFSIYKI
eukprot:SAG11_NODE_1007_length_6206_cov_36.144752_3_plen_71_part_00